MGATELAEGAKKAVKEAVTEQAPSFIGGLLSGAWNLVKSVLPYVLIIPGILIADEKLNEGKGLKFIKGLFGGKDGAQTNNTPMHEQTPPKGQNAPTASPDKAPKSEYQRGMDDINSIKPDMKASGVKVDSAASGASTPAPAPTPSVPPKDGKSSGSGHGAGKP